VNTKADWVECQQVGGEGQTVKKWSIGSDSVTDKNRRRNMTGMDTFDHESIQDRQSIRQYLNTLIEGIEKGSIIFTSEKENVMLIPAEMICISIKTKIKSGKSKLTIKLAWNDSTVKNSREKSNAIQIAS
jgi:amphi-Trp domain-containing protein